MEQNAFKFVEFLALSLKLTFSMIFAHFYTIYNYLKYKNYKKNWPIGRSKPSLKKAF